MDNRFDLQDYIDLGEYPVIVEFKRQSIIDLVLGVIIAAAAIIFMLRYKK